MVLLNLLVVRLVNWWVGGLIGWLHNRNPPEEVVRIALGLIGSYEHEGTKAGMNMSMKRTRGTLALDYGESHIQSVKQTMHTTSTDWLID